MRDDPGFWWEVRWYLYKVRWVQLAVLIAVLVGWVWLVVRGWQ